MGVFGVRQSVVELAHPPQAPLEVHLSVPPQLSGFIEQGLQVLVPGSQIGLSPLQPALLRVEAHSTHLPATHSPFASTRPEQSDESRHSTQLGEPEDGTWQKLSAPVPEQARFALGSHSQVRDSHAAASPSGQAVPQLSHSSRDVFLQAGPEVVGQHSSSAAHPA